MVTFSQHSIQKWESGTMFEGMGVVSQIFVVVGLVALGLYGLLYLAWMLAGSPTGEEMIARIDAAEKAEREKPDGRR